MPDNSICKTRILSQEYRDFIIGNILPPSFENINKDQLCMQEIVYGYDCIYVEEFLADPLDLDKYYYNTIPNCYSLLDLNAMNDAGILPIQNFPTLQLQGEGILMGFIDTGIDYQNDVFKTLDGRTRIEAIWDQTIQTGAPPEGYLYGTEYRREIIDEALKSEIPMEIVPSVDENGHGTFIASIAAGSPDIEEQFIGAAPEATIAMVKLKEAKDYLREFYYVKEGAPCYQENDIMLAIKYLKQLADEKGIPLILCIALGTNLGSHTGIAPLSDILNQYADVSQMAIVLGTGNETNEKLHYFGRATLDASKEEQVEEIEIRVGESVRGFIIEFWTEIPNLFSLSVVSPSGEEVPQSPLKRDSGGEYYFIFEQTKLSMDYRLLVEKSNSELVFFRFTNPTPGIWKIRVNPIQLTDGNYHMWLTDKAFLTGDVEFLESDAQVTICEPANARFPITVSYYNGLQQSIDIHSGRGYTRSGVMKPDFAAPGVDVKGALPKGRFAKRTGSSIATAITAGASALLMEWNVYQLGERNISSIQIKNLLILGTTRDENLKYPNEEWGYGMLDLFNTFQRIREL